MKRSVYGVLAAQVMAVCLVIAGVTQVWAEEPRLRDSHPDQYTVVRGDTLWDISDKFLENPWKWPEIWHVNPQISNPHLIYPGDTITLIYLDGRPRLTVRRGNTSSFRSRPGDVKLSPSIHVVPLGDAIPAIPLDAIDNFLSRSRVVGLDELEGAPYVLQGASDHLIVGAGDDVYARGEFDDDVPAYGVYRRGETYIDPDTGEFLGLQALDIGTAKLKSVERDIGTLAVTRTTQEIRPTDRLLAHEERSIDSTFFPTAPEDEVNGVILAVEGGVSQVGKLSVVVLNRGEREGLEVGNVLAIYKKGSVVRDRVTSELVTLPEERAGLLMVFRAYRKMSLGLVLESDRPLAVKDKVRKP